MIEGLVFKIAIPKKKKVVVKGIKIEDKNVQGIVFIDEYNAYKVKIPSKNNLILPFTTDSFSIKGKTTIFSRYIDEKGRHIRYIRNEDKAKLSADNRALYIPFAPNWIVKGNIIRDNGVIKFDFLNLITKNGYNTINNTDYE